MVNEAAGRVHAGARLLMPGCCRSRACPRACAAEIGQAEPPAEEPKQAFERLVAFMKQHLVAAA